MHLLDDKNRINLCKEPNYITIDQLVLNVSEVDSLIARGGTRREGRGTIVPHFLEQGNPNLMSPS